MKNATATTGAPEAAAAAVRSPTNRRPKSKSSPKTVLPKEIVRTFSRETVECSGPSSLVQVPYHVWLHFATYLNPEDALSLAHSCKSVHAIIQSANMWHLRLERHIRPDLLADASRALSILGLDLEKERNEKQLATIMLLLQAVEHLYSDIVSLRNSQILHTSPFYQSLCSPPDAAGNIIPITEEQQALFFLVALASETGALSTPKSWRCVSLETTTSIMWHQAKLFFKNTTKLRLCYLLWDSSLPSSARQRWRKKLLFTKSLATAPELTRAEFNPDVFSRYEYHRNECLLSDALNWTFFPQTVKEHLTASLRSDTGLFLITSGVTGACCLFYKFCESVNPDLTQQLPVSPKAGDVWFANYLLWGRGLHSLFWADNWVSEHYIKPTSFSFPTTTTSIPVFRCLMYFGVPLAMLYMAMLWRHRRSRARMAGALRTWKWAALRQSALATACTLTFPIANFFFGGIFLCSMTIVFQGFLVGWGLCYLALLVHEKFLKLTVPRGLFCLGLTVFTSLRTPVVWDSLCGFVIFQFKLGEFLRQFWIAGLRKIGEYVGCFLLGFWSPNAASVVPQWPTLEEEEALFPASTEFSVKISHLWLGSQVVMMAFGFFALWATRGDSKDFEGRAYKSFELRYLREFPEIHLPVTIDPKKIPQEPQIKPKGRNKQIQEIKKTMATDLWQWKHWPEYFTLPKQASGITPSTLFGKWLPRIGSYFGQYFPRVCSNDVETIVTSCVEVFSLGSFYIVCRMHGLSVMETWCAVLGLSCGCRGIAYGVVNRLQQAYYS